MKPCIYEMTMMNVTFVIYDVQPILLKTTALYVELTFINVSESNDK